ncbi:DNRLRE domain-containing protein [Chondromyces crocatus]|uniref:Carbohydrate-binding module family 96 domain-containing protein n=1 Tax=Chondromyces crocatus TaxID=52 RepID=A0A0K1EFF4_CHOCO|nr:DNRLRE domain-containing protein [Chondromyces crocatus]AKT39590.1 uncharacterized protein CMC5_037390 [Chondromyces crocatus]
MATDRLALPPLARPLLTATAEEMMIMLTGSWRRVRFALISTGTLSCAALNLGCLDPGGLDRDLDVDATESHLTVNAAKPAAGTVKLAGSHQAAIDAAKAAGGIANLGPDTDGDGLSDADEIALGLDPFNADADGDGIPDPIDLDLDNDGIPNAIECHSAALSLANGSFEQPSVPSGTYQLIPKANMPGWQTTAPDQVFEVWGTGFLGVPAAEGRQFAELNANHVSTLYQDINTTPGQVYLYRFYHRGRQGADTLAFSIGAPGASVEIRQVTTGNSAWQLVTGVYTIPAGQTVSRFSFESVSAAGGNPGVGNFLDGISFTPGCTLDTDGDGIPDARDSDSDNDGIPDGVEAGHGLADEDGWVSGPYGANGLADSVETAIDSGIINYTVADTDGNGTYDFQQVNDDVDGDGVPDEEDNCPDVYNPSQIDNDGDGVGNACDLECVTVQRGTFGDVQDSFIKSDSLDFPYGAYPYLLIGPKAGTLATAYVRHDVSFLPLGAEIASATLTVSYSWRATSGAVDVHRTLASWSEATLTWNNAASFDPAVTSQLLVPTGAGTSSTDLTALVQTWVDGVSPNHGVTLTGVDRTELRSSEHLDLASRPKLAVCYYAPDTEM